MAGERKYPDEQSVDQAFKEVSAVVDALDLKDGAVLGHKEARQLRVKLVGALMTIAPASDE